MPLSEALAGLQTRKRALSRSFACVAGGLLVNLHITHESALRALHPAAQDIRSLMSAEKQMSACAAACFSFALIISWLGFNHKETKTL